MATICDDEFMTDLTSLINRSLCALSEDHFYFNGPDPQIMMHVWREEAFISPAQASDHTIRELMFAPTISPQLNNGSRWNYLTFSE